MELQINSLETRIEKMQEMFNKDLEEIKQSISTEIKSTLKGANRITETEDRISEEEDRTVEINEAERKKELKEMRTTSETSGTKLNAPTFESQGSQKTKTKRNAMRKYLRR